MAMKWQKVQKWPKFANFFDLILSTLIAAEKKWPKSSKLKRLVLKKVLDYKAAFPA